MTPRISSQRPRLRKGQDGLILLESLVAILIFSLGVLALLALQGNTMKRVGDNKYRADAAYLANELIGTIWATGAVDKAKINTFACAAPCVDSSNVELKAWLGRVQGALPGVVLASKANAPAITVVNSAAGRQVTITLNWAVPSTQGGAPMTGRYQATAYINPN
ncbi:hypothetical protein [Chitinimonas lacunae]|uniref:Type IV pilus modification protein PilV n=1 Tax=Chitinimonas lacunae TaxID=1963018 RepID=A0ABV8MRG2_9NEIS